MIDWSVFDGIPLLSEEPLAKYTAARIGGPGERVLVARDPGEFPRTYEAIARAWKLNVPIRILGGGANVLISDSGVRGLIVVNHMTFFAVQDDPDPAYVIVTVDSGTTLTVLARKLAAQGIDFAWAASVPGTIGGAVVNNAGAHGGDMASDVWAVQLILPERGEYLTVDELAYGYRTSALKTRADRRFFVQAVTLRLRRDDPAAIAARIEANIAHRKQTQPPGASLGSIFKNPPGDYAGRLIESCGLKGFAIGGAVISPVHANFFINRGGASARDYAALIDHARETVLRQTGVALETEVELIGQFP